MTMAVGQQVLNGVALRGKAARKKCYPNSNRARVWAGKFLEVVAGASVGQRMNIEYRARSDEG